MTEVTGGAGAVGPGGVMEMPALLSLLPVFSFSLFFHSPPAHFPADEREHFLPVPTLITLCLPRESMSLSLFIAPSLIKG